MMSNRTKRYVLAIVAVPFLVVTAWAQPNTPPATSPTQPVSAEQKARDDEIARLNHAKSVAELQKAIRAAEGSSLFGSLETYKGAEGKTTVEKADGRSQLEATLLSSLAMREAVEPLARHLSNVLRRLSAADRRLDYDCVTADVGPEDAGCRAALPIASASAIEELEPRQLCREVTSLGSASVVRPRPIIIVTEDARGPIALAEIFEVRSAGIARELCRALHEAGEQTDRFRAMGLNLPPNAEGSGGSAAFAAAGTAINTVANLLRTDYTIYGITLTPDQNLLIRELARELLSRRISNPLYTPGLFPVGQTTLDNPVMRRIALLDRLRGAASDAVASHVAQARVLERALPTAGARTAQVREAKDAHDTVRKRLEAAIKAYEDMINQLSTPQGTEPPALASMIRQASTAERLRQGGLLVVTNVHFIGGTSYTKQNFFSSLFGMPNRVSGGVLVSYIVQDGQSGRVHEARSVPVSGGFHRPTEIRRVVQEANRRQDQQDCDANGESDCPDVDR